MQHSASDDDLRTHWERRAADSLYLHICGLLRTWAWFERLEDLRECACLRATYWAEGELRLETVERILSSPALAGNTKMRNVRF